METEIKLDKKLPASMKVNLEFSHMDANYHEIQGFDENGVYIFGFTGCLTREQSELIASVPEIRQELNELHENYDYVVSVRESQAKELTRLQTVNTELLAALQAIVTAEDIDLYIGDEWGNAKSAIAKAKGL